MNVVARSRSGNARPMGPQLYRVRYQGRTYLLSQSQISQLRARIAASRRPPPRKAQLPAPSNAPGVDALALAAGRKVAGALGIPTDPLAFATTALTNPGALAGAAAAIAPFAPLAIGLGAIGIPIASLVFGKSTAQMLAEAQAAGQAAVNEAGAAGTLRLQDDTRVVNAGGQRSRTNILGITREH